MLTLIDFIKNVEDEVFEKVLFYTRHQDKFGLLPTIWVHQLKGKVTLDFPSRPSGYAHLPIYKLCNLDKYQVYARFVLLDTVTGYRSQYQEGAFIIMAR